MGRCHPHKLSNVGRAACLKNCDKQDRRSSPARRRRPQASAKAGSSAWTVEVSRSWSLGVGAASCGPEPQACLPRAKHCIAQIDLCSLDVALNQFVAIATDICRTVQTFHSNSR